MVNNLTCCLTSGRRSSENTHHNSKAIIREELRNVHEYAEEKYFPIVVFVVFVFVGLCLLVCVCVGLCLCWFVFVC